jgi:hypothetical protein
MAKQRAGEIALGGAEAPFDGLSATYFPGEREARAAAAQFSGDIVVACDEHAMGQKPAPQINLKKIVASFALPETDRDPAFDGMVELYFASVEDICAMFAGPVPAMMRKDEENFAQMDAPAVRVVAREVVL